MPIFFGVLFFLNIPILSRASTVLPGSEYSKKSNELRNLDSKIKDAENRVKTYLSAKSKAATPAAQNEARTEMLKAHEEMKTLTKDYNKVRTELKYKFPGKGEEIEAHYQQRSVKTIDEIDHSSSLDAQLTKTKRIIDKKFAPLAGPPELPKAAPAEAKVPSTGPEESPPLRLER